MSTPTPLFEGRACRCVPAPDRQYALVTPSGRTIGTLRWHATAGAWVFVPAPDTKWTSGTLMDVGRWLRLLQREHTGSQA
jgi:hypothetical protein